MQTTTLTASSISAVNGETPFEAAVYLDGASPAFVAALQSTLLNDVPCVGVHTVWLDDAPKYVHGDVLALRAAQCGWTLDAASQAPACSGTAAADQPADDGSLTAALHPDTAYLGAVAHGSFDFVAGPACGYEFCAQHVAWDTPRVSAVHPRIVLAELPPGARISGEMVLAWGTARHGPAWRCVPRVCWTAEAHLTWLRDPCELSEAQVAALEDVLLESACDVVDGAVVGQPQAVQVNSGLQELADTAEWKGVLQYEARTPQDRALHLVTVRTNGQHAAIQAVHTALRVMAADANAIVEHCAR